MEINDDSIVEVLDHDYNDENFLANVTTLYRSKIINPADQSGNLHYSDLPHILIEPVTGITIDKTDKVSLYMRVRKTRVFARNVTRSVIPYFQMESKASAKPDDLNKLELAISRIEENKQGYQTLCLDESHSECSCIVDVCYIQPTYLGT